MELYKEILIHILAKENISVTFPDLHIDTKEIVELECYKALHKIKEILLEDSFDDKKCFEKIEEIVCAFEDVGSSGGPRHDF